MAGISFTLNKTKYFVFDWAVETWAVILIDKLYIYLIKQTATIYNMLNINCIYKIIELILKNRSNLRDASCF